MADRKATIDIDVRGADRAAAAARSALGPWHDLAEKTKGSFRDLGRDAARALGGVLSDLGRVVTVGSSISFAGAVAGVHSFERATAELAVASRRDLEGLRTSYEALGKRVGETPQEVAAFVRAAGRASYDFAAPERNLEAFAAHARATGRELQDQVGLQGAFKRLGIEDASAALSQLRATAGDLRTVGGPAALADQFEALAGSISRSSNSAEQLVAFLGELAKRARSPQEAQELQRGVVGSLGDPVHLERHLRFRGLLKKGDKPLVDVETGEVDLVRLAELRREDLLRRGRKRAFQIATRNLGGDTRAAAAFLNADFGAARRARADPHVGVTELDDFLATDAGRRARNEARRQAELRKVVGSGSVLGRAAAEFDDLTAAHPLLGKGVEVAAGVGLSFLGGKLAKYAIGTAAAGAAAAAAGSVLPTIGTGLLIGGLTVGGALAARRVLAGGGEQPPRGGVGPARRVPRVDAAGGVVERGSGTIVDSLVGALPPVKLLENLGLFPGKGGGFNEQSLAAAIGKAVAAELSNTSLQVNVLSGPPELIPLLHPPGSIQ